MKRIQIILYSLAFLALCTAFMWQRTQDAKLTKELEAIFAAQQISGTVKTSEESDNLLALMANKALQKPLLAPLVKVAEDILSEKEKTKALLLADRKADDLAAGKARLFAFREQIMVNLYAASGIKIKGIKLSEEDLELLNKNIRFDSLSNNFLLIFSKSTSWTILEDKLQKMAYSALCYISANLGSRVLCCYGCYPLNILNSGDPIRVGETKMLQVAVCDHSPYSRQLTTVSVNGKFIAVEPDGASLYRFVPTKLGWDSLDVRINHYNYKHELLKQYQKWVKFYVQ